MKKSLSAMFIIVILSISILAACTQNFIVEAQGVLNPRTDGLMAWWKLDEGSGRTVADSSGNNYDGTITGCQWVKNGGITSLGFNGAQSDFVSLPSFDLQNIDSLTVVSWINSDLSKVGFIVFLGDSGTAEMGNGDLSEETQRLNLNPDHAGFSVKLSNGHWVGVSSPVPMQPNTWHQIVGVWVRGTSLKVYVDGSLAAQTDDVANLGLFNSGYGFPNSLGIYSQNLWSQIDYFKGQMSNVMIYSKALSDQEIQTLNSQFGQSLHTPSLTLSCTSQTSQQVFNVFKISGDLTSDGIAIPNAPVYVSYSVTNGESWQDLTLLYTDADGTYSALWLPTVTSNYQIKAIYKGDENNLGAVNTINIAIQPSADQNVFSISSNSTITALSFNPESKQLKFNVTGDGGTSGYTYVFIPNALLTPGNELTVQLDNSPINYTVNQQDNGWLLFFAYHHSSHVVTISLDLTSAEPKAFDFSEIENYVLLVVIACTAAAITVLLAVFRMSKKNTH
ncbi:MAG: LamG domain-containing protein [Candidatus Bathyarchaeota archaeon]|nr:LamG domain-containing protein [Candidatus Bathyarchaeota archaeon]